MSISYSGCILIIAANSCSAYAICIYNYTFHHTISVILLHLRLAYSTRSHSNYNHANHRTVLDTFLFPDITFCQIRKHAAATPPSSSDTRASLDPSSVHIAGPTLINLTFDLSLSAKTCTHHPVFIPDRPGNVQRQPTERSQLNTT
jgi:hypothetical protein